MIAYADLQASLRATAEAEQAERRATLDAWIGASDRLLNRLEQLNARDVEALPDVLLRHIRQAALRLSRLGVEPPPFRPDAGKNEVQQAVDYLFDELQGPALLLKDPHSALADPDITLADLAGWSDICQWLEGFGPAGLAQDVPAPERHEELLMMHAHGLVYVRRGARWRARADWMVRLARLRAEVAG